MFDNFKKIFVLVPHPDDGELGCGGTISRLLEKGAEVFYISFSLAERVGDKDTGRKSELIRASRVLGIPENNLISYQFPIRYFSGHFNKIRDEMFFLNKKLNPDTVFLPSLNDIHQDHRVIAKEGIRIFKQRTVLCYECPWNNYKFFPDLFVELKPSHLEKKIGALKEYQSQAGKKFMEPDFLKSLAKVRGVQAGTDFAEAFKVIRIKY